MFETLFKQDTTVRRCLAAPPARFRLVAGRGRRSSMGLRQARSPR